MSSLIVEVCEIQEVCKHPTADRLEVIRIRGWDVVVGKGLFKPKDKVVYFPPDCQLPLEIAEKHGVTKYLGSGSRVKVANLRGFKSYGYVAEVDDPTWEIGRDVAEHYGITKYEPPLRANQGDAEKPHHSFHHYYDMENIMNFPDVFQEGEEVVCSEKGHGENIRLALFRDTNDKGEPIWSWGAGTHNVRRKRYFRAKENVNDIDIKEPSDFIGKKVEKKGGKPFQSGIKVATVKSITKNPETDNVAFLFEEDDSCVDMTQCCLEKKLGEVQESTCWQCFSKEIREMLCQVSGCGYTPEEIDAGAIANHGKNVVLFGERLGMQDMKYGYTNEKFGFLVFDIAVNHKYMDFDDKTKIFETFNTPAVPIIWRGAYNFNKIKELAEGPSLISKEQPFREGIVITSVKERQVITEKKVMDRAMLKCISFAYLNRREGSEFH